MATRVYVVKSGDMVRMIEAKSRQAAVAHFVKGLIEIKAATTKDVLAAARAGTEIESAEEEQEEG